MTETEMAVVELPPDTVLVPVKDDCDRLLAMMDAATQSGKIDVLDKIVPLYKEILAIKAEQQFNEALQRFQAKEIAIPRRRTAGGVSAGSGKSMRWKYANREDIMEAIGPALHECGLSIMCSEVEPRKYAIELRHKNGHRVPITKTIPPYSAKTVNPLQAAGVEQEYAMRYGIIGLLNLTNCEEGGPEDSPQAREPITEKQAQTILQLLESTKADKERFLKHISTAFGAADVRQIAQGDYVDVLNKINEAAKARRQRDANAQS